MAVCCCCVGGVGAVSSAELTRGDKGVERWCGGDVGKNLHA